MPAHVTVAFQKGISQQTYLLRRVTAFSKVFSISALLCLSTLLGAGFESQANTPPSEIDGAVIAGSLNNRIAITITNPSAEIPIEKANLEIVELGQWITNIRIEQDAEGPIAPKTTRRFTVLFDILPEAEHGAVDEVALQVTARGALVDHPNPLISVRIENPAQTAQVGKTDEKVLKLVTLGLNGEGKAGTFHTSVISGRRTIQSFHLTEFPLEIVLGKPFTLEGEIKQRVCWPDKHRCFDEERKREVNWSYGPSMGVKIRNEGAKWLQEPKTAAQSLKHELYITGKHIFQPFCDEAPTYPDTYSSANKQVYFEKDGDVSFTMRFLPVDRNPDDSKNNYYYRIEVDVDGKVIFDDSRGMASKFVIFRLDKWDYSKSPLQPAGVHFLFDSTANHYLFYALQEKDSNVISFYPPYSHPAQLSHPPKIGSITSQEEEPEEITGTDEETGSAGETGSVTGEGDTPEINDRVEEVRGEPIDPNTLDPNIPDVKALIHDWISVAEPPENVTEGARLRYEKWGRKIGTTADGVTVTATAKPDFALSTPEETVWSARKELDSVNHCTVEEYVLARLENRSIEKCRERFKAPETVAVEKLTGLTLPDAKKRLVDAGLKPRLIAGKPAPSREKEGTVVSQDPGPGTELKPGNSVEIRVYGPYNPKVVVPDVTGLEVKKAQAKLKDEGLKVRLVASGPAPSNELSLRIRASEPKKGTKVSPGTEVVVKVYGKYSPPLVTVPEIQGLSFYEAKDRLARVGLKVSPRSAGTAPSEDKASRVKSQQPGAGTKVNPDSLVKVYVFSKYIPPTPPVHEDGTGQQEETTAGAWKLVGRTGPKVTSQPGCRKPVFQGRTVHYLTEPDYGYWDFSFSWQEPPKVILPDKEYSLSITSMAERRGTPTGEAGVGARIGIGVKGIRSSILKCFANGEKAKPDYFAWSGVEGSVNGVARILLEPNDPDQFKISLWITDGGCSFALIGEYTYQREKRVPLVQVPDVKGLSFAEASRRIRQKGLKVKPVAAGSAPSQQTSEKIAMTRPAAGQKVTSGYSITVHVYSKYIPATGGGDSSGSGSGSVSRGQSGSCNDFMGTWEFNLGFDQYRVHVCPEKREFKNWGNKIQILYARDKQSNQIKKAGFWYCKEKNGKPDMTFYWYDEKWLNLVIKDNRLIGKISNTNDRFSGRKISSRPNCKGSNGLDSDCDLVGSFEKGSTIVKFTTRDGVNFVGKAVRHTRNTYSHLHPVGATWFTLERQHVNPLGGSTYIGKEYDAKGRLYRNVVVIAGCKGINVNKRGENQGGLWERVD